MTNLLAPVQNHPYVGGDSPGAIQVTATGLQNLVKNNFLAALAPTVTDDSAAGFQIGSTWWTQAGEYFFLDDASVGAAAWTLVGGGTGLPLTGGTLTGPLVIDAGAADVPVTIQQAATPIANAFQILAFGGGELVVVDAAANITTVGRIFGPDGSTLLPAYSFTNATGTAVGMFLYDVNTLGLRGNGNWGLNLGQGFVRLATNNLQWGQDFNNADVNLSRSPVGTLNVGNGTTGNNTGTLSLGNLLQGTTTPPTGTSGKVHVYGDNTGDPTMGSNTAATYGKDVAGTVHMFAIGETGAATQLSSHDPDTEEWIHYSYNKRTGKKLRINLERFFHDKYPEYITEYQKGEK